MNPNGTLTLAKTSQWVPQSGQKTLDFTVARGADTPAGALTVHVTGLPTGVTAADVSVATSAAGGTLTFSADTSSTLGSSTGVTVELQAGTQTLDSKPFTVRVSGAPGTLDTTYGTNGRAVFPLPDPAVAATTGNGLVRAIAQYPAGAGVNAGKLVAVAEDDTTGATTTTFKYGVIRLNVDGSPDTTFGGGAGYVLVDGSPAHAFTPIATAIDSQNRIVVVSYHQNTSDVCLIHVVRLTTTGALDSSFTTFDALPDGVGYCGNANAMAILPGDKIAIVSTWNNPDGSQRPLITQLNSDGTPDTGAYNGAFSVRLPAPDTGKPSWQVSRKMFVDSAGNWLIAGRRCEGGWNATYSACESVVGRITAAGAWDTTWGTGGAGNAGYSQLTFGTTSNTSLIQQFYTMTLDASGNLVVGGFNEGYTTAVLARFLGTTGAVDTSFGNSGRITPVLVQGGQYQEVNDLVVDSDGNVTAAGYTVSGGSLIANTRYTSSGVLDTTYGTGGVQTTPEAGLNVNSVLQADDRMIVSGAWTRGTNGFDVAIWRFWP